MRNTRVTMGQRCSVAKAAIGSRGKVIVIALSCEFPTSAARRGLVSTVAKRAGFRRRRDWVTGRPLKACALVRLPVRPLEGLRFPEPGRNPGGPGWLKRWLDGGAVSISLQFARPGSDHE